MPEPKSLPKDLKCLHCGRPAIIRLPGTIIRGKVRTHAEIPICAECLAVIEQQDDAE